MVGIAAPVALNVRAIPEYVRLGTDSSAELRIESPVELDGAPELTASVGRVEVLKATGARSWSARYVPPDPTYPQVAVVAAIGRTAGSPAAVAAVGWTSLPLWGQGEALVRARGGARITVRIGDRTFGPVTANARGVAYVPVVVPPGIPLGYYGKQPVELGLPPTPHLHLVPGRDRLRSERAAEVPLYLFAVDDDGRPRPKPQFRIAVQRGTVSPPRELSPGLYAATWSVPAGDPGVVEISAWLHDEPRQRVAAPVEMMTGVPVRLLVESARARIGPADPRVTLTVRAFDQLGRATPARLDVSSSFGTLAPISSAGPGRYDYELSLPSAFGGLRHVAIDARATESTATGRLDIPLEPGPPARIVLASGALDAVADGVTAAVLRFHVVDAHGNPIQTASLAPLANVNLGALSRPEPLPDGGFALKYQPPVLERAADATLEISAGAARLDTSISLHPRARWLHLAARVGAVSNGVDVTAPTGSLEVFATPRLMGQTFGVGLELGGLLFGPPDTVGELPLRGRHRYVDVLASVSWLGRLGPAFGVRAGLLAGGSRVDSTLALGAQPELTEGTFVPSAAAAAALSTRLGPGAAFVELRVGFRGDPGLYNLRGALLSGQLTLGYAFGLL